MTLPSKFRKKLFVFLLLLFLSASENGYCEIVLDKNGTIVPSIDEFKADIPFWSIPITKRKRKREIAEYWVAREKDLKQSVLKCQSLEEQNAIENCYQQLRKLESYKTIQKVQEGREIVARKTAQQREMNSALIPLFNNMNPTYQKSVDPYEILQYQQAKPFQLDNNPQMRTHCTKVGTEINCVTN